MWKRCKRRRGIVLLQVLVMSVVLGILAIGILRWVLSRKYLVRQMTRMEGAGNAVQTCLNEFNAFMEGGGWNGNGSQVSACSGAGIDWNGCSSGATVTRCRDNAYDPWTVTIVSGDLTTY